MSDSDPVKLLRFAILGTARIAPKALIAPAQQVPGVAVTAVASRDLGRAHKFADTYGLPRAFGSYAEALNDPEIDAVYIALPNSLHCEWSIRALRTGHHVLCEKPFAANGNEAEQMAQVARQAGCLLAEAMHYRYHPLAVRVRSILSGGLLGRLIQIDARFAIPIRNRRLKSLVGRIVARRTSNIQFQWELAGGATMNLGCYPLHMIREFCAAKLSVRWAKAVSDVRNIDISMTAGLELETGARATMYCSMAPDAVPGASFTARGERGELLVTNPVSPQIGHSLWLRTAEGEVRESFSGNTTFYYQLAAFAAAVRDKTTVPTDAADAVIGMRLIDDIYRAARLPPRGT